MSTNTIIKKGIPHLVACLIFIALSAFYFSAQLDGKVEKSHDILGARANLQEIENYKKSSGDHTLWTNTLFGGMPTYQIDSSQPKNLTKHAYKASRFFIPRPIGMFVSAMLIFYIMLVLLGVNPWLSIVGSIAFGLTTNNYVLYGAGHITKIYSVIHLGLMTAGLLLAMRKKKYLLGALIFGLGMALDLLANHIQMTYYFLLTVGLYGLIELGYHIYKKDIASFGKAAGYLFVAGLLALGSNAGKLITTYEYSKDTMRGDPILAYDANAQGSSSNVSGLDPGYATNWSNGWMDLVANFIPGIVGGGGLEYWGPNVDGTAGPAYYGAIVFFLFLLGAVVVRGPTKWWLLSGVILISLISLGRNFFLHGLLFDIVPLFNKFRTPNSALSVVAFLVPVLGILGLNEIVQGRVDKAKAIQALYITAGTLLGICLIFALFGGSIFDFVGAKDAAYAERGVDFRPIMKRRASMMSGDSWRSFGLILVAAGLLWAFLKEKINSTVLIAALGVLIAGDLWTVNKNYLNDKNFVSPRGYKSEIAPRPVDEQILGDKDPNYRVFDISGGYSAAVNSSAQTNKTSYYHKNTGGYHPAKLQRYDDILSRHIFPETQQLVTALQQGGSIAAVQPALQKLTVFNMMNTKYFIYSDQGAIPNENALGNAWFVNSFKTVNTPNEEIDAVRGIDAAQQAIVHKEFSDYLAGLNIQKNGTISLKEYKPNHLTYSSNTSSDQLAVFSEVWYGPDKGWNAYIDGNAVDHIRVNYVLRGLKVPSGQHTIEFKFEPKTYSIGSTLSLICSLVLLLGLLGYIGYYFKQKANEPAVVKNVQKTKTKNKIKPTSSKKKPK